VGSIAEAVPVKYRTLRRLAVGGMGEIFLAREQGRLSRLVVIKKMLPQVARSQASVDMFVDEARIVGQLAHPNICQIFELGDEAGVPFIVLEYVRGESVSAIWDRVHAQREQVPLPLTLRIVADTARALHFAHEALDPDGQPLHIIHRDVTPHNVMVTFDGDVKLMDFGVARAENRQHRTDTGQIKGKIAYMSPEQLHGMPLDRRADVFALGVMLWELTLQQRLFRGADQVETLRKAAACVVPLPRSIDPDYPPALEAIVMRALAADRAQRTATAGELAAALTEQVAALGGAERDDIAACMRRLFPQEAALDDGPTIVDPDVQHFQTVSPPVSEPRPTVPLTVPRSPDVTVPEAPKPPEAAERPADLHAQPTALLGPRRERNIARADDVAPSVHPVAPRSRRGLAFAVVAVVAAAGGVTAWIATRAPNGANAASAASAASAAVDAGAAVATIDQNEPIAPDAAHAVEPSAAEPASVAQAPDAPAKVTRANPTTRRQRGTPAAARHPATQSSPPDQAAVTAEPQAAKPADGLIAVSSHLTGIVFIDGVRRKSTPFQTELSVGHHVVSVELAEGAGTVRAPVEIVVGRKTKCMAKAGVLSCDTPR
jgi:serine/threonine-protein kinase